MDADLYTLYTSVINHVCEDWTQNCDGGCYEDIGQRKILKEGPWTFLFQAKKGFFEQYHSDVAFLLTHKDHKTLSETMFREDIQPVLDRVHEEFFADLDRVLNATQGLWLTAAKSRTIQDILCMEPWTLSSDKKRVRTTQSLRGDDQTLSCGAQRFSRKDLSKEFLDDCRVKVEFVCGCGQPYGHALCA